MFSRKLVDPMVLTTLVVKSPAVLPLPSPAYVQFPMYIGYEPDTRITSFLTWELQRRYGPWNWRMYQQLSPQGEGVVLMEPETRVDVADRTRAALL